MELTVQDLLKPLKDALLKNWSTSLAHVLDDFIHHLLVPTTGLNFTEAAVIIQNSTNFYCKRLDHVFKLVEELTENVNHLYKNVYRRGEFEIGEHCKVAGNLPTPKKRRITRILENDDLEVLAHIITDHSIDLNISRPKNSPQLRHIVLTRDAKTPRKANTAISLANAAGVFYGHKEDFRLGGKTWTDGTVNSDFHVTPNVLTYALPTAENGCENLDTPVNSHPSPERPSTPCNPEAPVDHIMSPPPPVKQLSVMLRKMEDCEPVTFKFTFPKALKRRRVFTLPKDLIEDAKKETEKRAKKQKRAKERQASKVVEHADDSQDTGYVSESPPSETILSSTETVPAQSEAISDFKLKRRESAQAAAEVAQRVSEWHAKMTPRLEEAEKRKKFNVHEYADDILNKFSDDDKTYKPFGEIMAGVPWEEVSRYFLAALCLANTYNVDIKRNSDSPNDFSLRVMSRVRHHKEMDRQVGNLS